MYTFIKHIISDKLILAKIFNNSSFISGYTLHYNASAIAFLLHNINSIVTI